MTIPKLSDQQVREHMRLTVEQLDALAQVSSGKAGRGAFATVAAIKLQLEIGHPELASKDPNATAPVVILIQQAEPPRVISAPESVAETLHCGKNDTVPENVTHDASESPLLLLDPAGQVDIETS